MGNAKPVILLQKIRFPEVGGFPGIFQGSFALDRAQRAPVPSMAESGRDRHLRVNQIDQQIRGLIATARRGNNAFLGGGNYGGSREESSYGSRNLGPGGSGGNYAGHRNSVYGEDYEGSGHSGIDDRRDQRGYGSNAPPNGVPQNPYFGDGGDGGMSARGHYAPP